MGIAVDATVGRPGRATVPWPRGCLAELSGQWPKLARVCPAGNCQAILTNRGKLPPHAEPGHALNDTLRPGQHRHANPAGPRPL